MSPQCARRHARRWKAHDSAEETGCAGAADSSLPPGDYVRIKIVDTAWAMDEANAEPRRTEPFSPPRPGMGTGLGFPWSIGIAAQSGGLLRIDSAPNVGTTMNCGCRGPNPYRLVSREFDPPERHHGQ